MSSNENATPLWLDCMEKNRSDQIRNFLNTSKKLQIYERKKAEE
jgi:hypothetical protein